MLSLQGVQKIRAIRTIRVSIERDVVIRQTTHPYFRNVDGRKAESYKRHEGNLL